MHLLLDMHLMATVMLMKMVDHPWREYRFLLTPAAKNNSAAPFCAIETNQVLRL